MKTQRLTVLSKAILLALAMILAVAFVSGNAAASADKSDIQFTYVTITEGQTLWGLASDYSKDQSQREWIASLVELNNLTTTDLQPGQKLALPN
jgi:LysM repeat protein